MNAWDLNRAALREHLAADNIEDFLRWSTVEKTMFVGDVGFVHKEYSDVMNDRHFTTRLITETKVGNPKLMGGWTSGNLIHQYYHLKQWLDRSKQNISELSSIVEVGAGYGAMALICHRLGFEGRYYIIDFPELEQIQAYYLGQTIPDARSHIHWIQPSPLVKSFDLLIACHSLSEMPVAEREKLLSQVDADAYLFASSYEFEGVDNDVWFGEFAESKPGYRWQQWAHPWQENALYSVGVRV